jgi:hypothetical protein
MPKDIHGDTKLDLISIPAVVRRRRARRICAYEEWRILISGLPLTEHSPKYLVESDPREPTIQLPYLAW